MSFAPGMMCLTKMSLTQRKDKCKKKFFLKKAKKQNFLLQQLESRQQDALVLFPVFVREDSSWFISGDPNADNRLQLYKTEWWNILWQQTLLNSTLEKWCFKEREAPTNHESNISKSIMN